MRRLRRAATPVAVLVLGAVLGTTACRQRVASPAIIPSPAAPVVLFFGDSITRGRGVADSETFPAMIQERLRAERLDYRCVNAGVSGDTTRDGIKRMPPYLADPPRVVVVELGANDAFRGINRLETRDNLLAIARAFTDVGARVVIAATLFPQVHPAYGLSMARMYAAVAHASESVLIGDLMRGVAGARELNLPDGIHPNPQGHARLADTAWPVLRDLLRELR